MQKESDKDYTLVVKHKRCLERPKEVKKIKGWSLRCYSGKAISGRS